MQFRQGDVFIQQVDSIPKGGKVVPRDRGRIVLAYGEVTGHAHAIAEGEVTMLEVDRGIRYLNVQMEAHLRHEEHGAVQLLPAGVAWPDGSISTGKFRVIRQREYTPEAIRNVAD